MKTVSVLDVLTPFLAGGIWMAYAVVGLFFLKFWRRTRDSLFLIFAIAFWILAALRVVLSFSADESELRTFLYLGRLLAYLLILWAIFRKNRQTARRSESV
jgi:uncharacterized membrane protein YeiB